MKKYLREHWIEYIYSLVLLCMAVLGISFIFGYVLETNDDAMLRNIVSGWYTGEPEAHMIYVMYPLGYILSGLYKLLPEVSWYDYYMVGLHYLCWFMILVRVGGQFGKKLNKIISISLCFVVLVIIDLPYVVMHQYTVLAAILVAVAVLWLITSKHNIGIEFWIARFVFCIFSILCLWTRKQVFLLALPIIAIIIFLQFIRDRKKIKEKKIFNNQLMFLTIFIALVLVSFGWDRYAYSGEEWKDFTVYNDARTDIYDFYGLPSYENHKDIYEELGLDYGDWIVMYNYNNKLAEGLSQEDIVTLADISEANWLNGFQYTNMRHKLIYDVVKNVYGNSVQPIGLILMMLYIAALVDCCKKDKKISFISVVCLLFFGTLVVGYFMWQGRFPERVSYGFYFVQALYLIGILLGNVEEKNIFRKGNIFWCTVWLILILGICAIFGLQRVRYTLDKKAELEQNCISWEQLNDYFEENDGICYGIDTSSIAYFPEKMFNKEQCEAHNMIRLGTWTQSSPLDAKRSNTDNVLALMMEGQCYYVQDVRQGSEWIIGFWNSKGYEIEIEVVDEITVQNGCTFEIINMSGLKKR